MESICSVGTTKRFASTGKLCMVDDKLAQQKAQLLLDEAASWSLLWHLNEIGTNYFPFKRLAALMQKTGTDYFPIKRLACKTLHIWRLTIQQKIKHVELGISVEEHEGELPDFPSFIPFLPPLVMILDYLASKSISKDLVAVSPDVGGVIRARAFAKKLSDAPLAIGDKRRHAHNMSQANRSEGTIVNEERLCRFMPHSKPIRNLHWYSNKL